MLRGFRIFGHDSAPGTQRHQAERVRHSLVLHPLPSAGSTVLSLTRGPAGIDPPPAICQTCCDINCTTRTTTVHWRRAGEVVEENAAEFKPQRKSMRLTLLGEENF